LLTHRNIRNTLLALGVALLVLPAALSDGHERQGHGKAGDRHGPPASVVEKQAQRKAAKRAHKVTYVFKGTFNLADSSVNVVKGNKHVRRAGLVGEQVVFDLTDARIVVADNNGDGERDATDLQDGDNVLVQARLPRREPGAAPFAARKLVDQSHKTEGEDTPEHHNA
jgi:hypothetical protein